MRAPGLVAALALAGWLGLPPAFGATFVLDDGSTIVGTIVQATRNTLTLRPEIGGLRQLPVGRLERVEVTTAGGQTLVGRYRDWDDGRSLIEVGTDLVTLENDRVVARQPLTTRALAAAPVPQAPAVASSAAPPAAKRLPMEDRLAAPSGSAASASAGAMPAAPPTVAHLPVEDPPGAPSGSAAKASPGTIPAAPPTAARLPMPDPPPALSGSAAKASTGRIAAASPTAARPVPDAPAAPGGSVSEDAATPPRRAQSEVIAPLPPRPDPEPTPEPAAGPYLAALPAGDLPVLSLKTSPEDVSEKSGTIALTVELSRPLEDLLVVIYSTVDGTARSDADYQPLQGILTLPAGVTSGVLRTAVMDDPEPEGDEDFQVFLASNPDLATLAEEWTKITIRDDD
jgi:hypothetical protein